MTEVIHQLTAGRRVALTRGGQQLAQLALAARDLKDGRRTAHPELVLFRPGANSRTTPPTTPQDATSSPSSTSSTPTDPTASSLPSTSSATSPCRRDRLHRPHREGREWPTVRIGNDFPPPKDTDQLDSQGRPVPEPVSDTDARLAYVAVTRARQHLDLGGLSWINSYPLASTALSSY